MDSDKEVYSIKHKDSKDLIPNQCTDPSPESILYQKIGENSGKPNIVPNRNYFKNRTPSIQEIDDDDESVYNYDKCVANLKKR